MVGKKFFAPEHETEWIEANQKKNVPAINEAKRRLKQAGLSPYLNESFRLLVFIFVTFIIHKLRTALQDQKEIAATDPLTSVSNRRAFHDLANLELNKARRYQNLISFLFFISRYRQF